MKKDLASAHLLAAEQNDLDHYKEILKSFVESKAAEAAEKEAAKEAARAAKKATKKATPKKSKAVADADGDVDMADASGEPDDEELEVAESEKPVKSKKRKPEEYAEVNLFSISVYAVADINVDPTASRLRKETQDNYQAEYPENKRHSYPKICQGFCSQIVEAEDQESHPKSRRNS
jgi:hypothetical protein